MLVLTRRTGQSIRIGDDITVHVIDVRGGQVRLGLEAPRDVTITRDDAKDGAK